LHQKPNNSAFAGLFKIYSEKSAGDFLLYSPFPWEQNSSLGEFLRLQGLKYSSGSGRLGTMLSIPATITVWGCWVFSTQQYILSQYFRITGFHMKNLNLAKNHRTSYPSLSSIFDLQADFTYSARLPLFSDLSRSIENRREGMSNSALYHVIREHISETAPHLGCCCMRQEDRGLKLEIVPRRHQRNFSLWGKNS